MPAPAAPPSADALSADPPWQLCDTQECDMEHYSGFAVGITGGGSQPAAAPAKK
eukprot:gene7387-22385_t